MSKLKFQKSFDYSTTVVCGKCKGNGFRLIDNREEVCTLCEGHGTLTRVTEGTMKLYTSDLELKPVNGNV